MNVQTLDPQCRMSPILHEIQGLKYKAGSQETEIGRTRCYWLSNINLK